MSENIVKILGFDWVLTLFMSEIHKSTLIIGIRILLQLVKHDHLLQKFKEGSSNGGWLSDADSVVRNRVAVLFIYCIFFFDFFVF